MERREENWTCQASGFRVQQQSFMEHAWELEEGKAAGTFRFLCCCSVLDVKKENALLSSQDHVNSCQQFMSSIFH
jgi:hypothetical protein